MEPILNPAERFCRLTRAVLRATRARDWDAERITVTLVQIAEISAELPRLRFTSPQANGYLKVAEACVDGLAAANGDVVPLEIAKSLRMLVLQVIVTMPDSPRFGWELKRADHRLVFAAGYQPPRREQWRVARTTVVHDDLPGDVRLACAAYFGRSPHHPANFPAVEAISAEA